MQIELCLCKINQGEWEGVLGSDIARLYPAQWAARERDPLNAHPPGGESVVEVAARAWAADDDIARRHLGGTALVVSHVLPFGALNELPREVLARHLVIRPRRLSRP